jgi:Ni/Co efflux regulator RcnB
MHFSVQNRGAGGNDERRVALAFAWYGRERELPRRYRLRLVAALDYRRRGPARKVRWSRLDEPVLKG